MCGGMSASRGHSRRQRTQWGRRVALAGAVDRGTSCYGDSDVYGDSYYVRPNRSCDSSVGAVQRDDSEGKPRSRQQRRRERQGSRGQRRATVVTTKEEGVRTEAVRARRVGW